MREPWVEGCSSSHAPAELPSTLRRAIAAGKSLARPRPAAPRPPPHARRRSAPRGSTRRGRPRRLSRGDPPRPLTGQRLSVESVPLRKALFLAVVLALAALGARQAAASPRGAWSGPLAETGTFALSAEVLVRYPPKACPPGTP